MGGMSGSLGGRSLLSRCVATAESSGLAIAAPLPRHATAASMLGLSGLSPPEFHRSGRSKSREPEGRDILYARNRKPLPEAGGEIFDILMAVHTDEHAYLSCSPPIRTGNPLVRDTRFTEPRWGVGPERNNSLGFSAFNGPNGTPPGSQLFSASPLKTVSGFNPVNCS